MQVVEGQQGPAVVLEAGVDGQQPQLVGQVAQPHGQGVKEDKELARQRMKKLLDRARKCGKALCASAWHRASM